MRQTGHKSGRIYMVYMPAECGFSMLDPIHEYVFFDSPGNPWRVCEVGHPEAEAFGPGVAARRLTGFHYNDVSSRTFESEDWTWLAPQGQLANGRPEYWVGDTYIP